MPDSAAAPIVRLCLGVAVALSSAAAVDPPATAPAEKQAIQIRGLVRDPARLPLPGATVRVLRTGLAAHDRTTEWTAPAIVQTGRDGRFGVAVQSSETYTVRIEAADHAPFTASEIPAGASLTIHLQEGYRVAGGVVDDVSGEPIAGATVRTCDADALTFGAEACRTVTTDETGRFATLHLPRGEVTLRAVARARAVSERRLELPAGGHEGVELRLGPGAAISGLVIDSEERPLGDVRVSFRASTDGRRGEPVHTGDDGRFVHPGLAVDPRWIVSARKPGFPEVKVGPFAVEAGRDVDDVRIRLARAATLRLRLLDGDGAPIDGRLSVRYRESRDDPTAPINDGASVPDSAIRPEGEGHYRIVDLRAGRYDLLLLAEHWADLERRGVVLRSGRVTDLGSLVARRGKSIRGRVAGPDGEPIAEARVSALVRSGDGFRQRSVFTDAEGRFSLSGLADAALPLVQVRADGFADASRTDVRPGDEAVDFVLEATGEIVGRVLLADGSPPAGFSLHAHRQADDNAPFDPFAGLREGQPPSGKFATKDGSFVLGEVAPGTYTLIARAPGKAPGQRGDIAVGAGELVDVGAITLDEGISVSGTVVELDRGTPVAGARIEAHVHGGFNIGVGRTRVQSTTSDESGRFVLEGLGSGAHRIRASHAAFAPGEIRVDLQAGNPEDALRIVLSEGGTLTGTVRDARGEPVGDARISLSRAALDGEEFRSTATGPDGTYEFRRIRPGSYNAMHLPGLASGMPNYTMKPAEIREGEVTVVDFEAAPRIALSGTVRRGNRTLPGTKLFFLSADGNRQVTGLKSARSDDTGRYAVGLDHPGRFRVIVQTQGDLDFSRSANVEIEVPDEPRVERDVSIRGGAVAGTVTRSDGSGLRGVAITAAPDGATGDSAAHGRAATDGNGSYRIDGLEPGTYRVTANTAGFRLAVEHPVTVADSETTRVDLELTPAGSLHGRVVDGRGQAVAGALVLVAASGSTDLTTASSGETDVNGAFRLSAPVDGPLDVTAIATGWAPARVFGVSAPEPDSPGLSMRLSRGARLRVRVLDAGGLPAASVQLELTPLPGFLGGELAMLTNPPPPTDAGGTTVVERLAGGSYEVAVAHAGKLATRAVRVEEGSEASIEIRLGADAVGAEPTRD